MRNSARPLTSALIVVLAATISPVHGQDSGPLGPGDILTAMRAAYAKVETYRDEGVGGDVGLRGPVDPDVRFRTTFARPDRLRIEFEKYSEYRDQWLPQILQWRGGEIEARSAPGNRSNLPSFALIDVQIGNFDLPMRLLAPDLVAGISQSATRDWQPEQLQGLRRDSDETLPDGTRCYRVSGRRRGHGQVTLWIDQETWMVRRVVGNGSDAVFFPQIGVPLTDADFPTPRVEWTSGDTARFMWADIRDYASYLPYGLPFAFLGWVFARRRTSAAVAMSVAFAGSVAVLGLFVVWALLTDNPFALMAAPFAASIPFLGFVVGYFAEALPSRRDLGEADASSATRIEPPGR